MAWRKLTAFIIRDFHWDLSYPLAFLWRLGSIVLNLIIFYFLGKMISQAASPHLAPYGGNYFAFAMVGLALASFQAVALSSISGSLHYEMFTGTLESMLATPTRLSTIVFSAMLYRFINGLGEVVIYFGLTAVFFELLLKQVNLAGAAVMLLLALLAHLPLGILSASFLLLFKRGDPLTIILGHLSALLGGVYFPVQILPAWLQGVAQLLPFTHALEGLRQAVLNGRGVADLGPQILVLALFAVVLMPLSLAAFAWSVRTAKKLGTLSQF